MLRSLDTNIFQKIKFDIQIVKYISNNLAFWDIGVKFVVVEFHWSLFNDLQNTYKQITHNTQFINYQKYLQHFAASINLLNGSQTYYPMTST